MRHLVGCQVCSKEVEKPHPGKFCSLSCAGQSYRVTPEKFMERVEKQSDGCWKWTGTTRRGYGVVGRDYKSVLAHRLAYEYLVGEIPNGMYVCHRCDNPICVNPEHLFLGTQIDNMADMVKKCRQARGASCKHNRLSEDEVLQIRSHLRSGKTLREISLQFGVAHSTIWRIRSEETWSWLVSNEK